MKGTIKPKKRISWMFVNGSKFTGVGFLALYCTNKQEDTMQNKKQDELAFIAGKKLGAAPMRSRAKRRLREAARSAGAPWEGYDVLFVARKGVIEAKFYHIEQDMERLGKMLLQDTINTAEENNQQKNERTVLQHKSAWQQTVSKEAKTIRENDKSISTLVVGIPRNIALLCISVYRHAISPHFPPSCRYVPTCSEYAAIAFKRFGFWRGLWLSVKRIGRCHPFAKGGYDPVPEA